MYCAGIVLFNPDIERLKENINAVYHQVDKLVLVNNCSENLSDIESLISSYENIVFVNNKENGGIAKALNQIVSEADKLGFKWVMTLDQDTVCKENIIQKYHKVLSENPDESIGMISCRYDDRNVKSKLGEMGENALEDVDFCITSCAFTNVKCVQNVGGFDEKMFIDMVDYDICYAFRKSGYRIVKANFVGFLHEVGESAEKKLFGKRFVVFNHSALRKYYWARNSVYMMRKYNLNKSSSYKRIYKRMIDTLLFEKQKFKKLNAMRKGIKDGKKL